MHLFSINVKLICQQQQTHSERVVTRLCSAHTHHSTKKNLQLRTQRAGPTGNHQETIRKPTGNQMIRFLWDSRNVLFVVCVSLRTLCVCRHVDHRDMSQRTHGSSSSSFSSSSTLNKIQQRKKQVHELKKLQEAVNSFVVSCWSPESGP